MSAISISGVQSPAVQITDAALRAKGIAIVSCRMVTTVKDEFEAEVAGTTLVEVAVLLKECEKSRKQIKQPILDLSREIDAKAQAFSADLEKHSDRIRGLIGTYRSKIEDEQRQAEAKRKAELDRIERERQAAEAESKRKADEALKSSTSPEQAEAAVSTAETEAKQLEARAREVSIAIESRSPLPPRLAPIAGVSVATVWKFEVIDIEKLHEFNPQFVTLTAKAREINAAIADGARTIQGLRIWEEKGVKVRA